MPVPTDGDLHPLSTLALLLALTGATASAGPAHGPGQPEAHTLRARPSDLTLARHAAGASLLVSHSLPGYVSVRAPGGAVRRLPLDPLTPNYSGEVVTRSVDLDADGAADLVASRRRAHGGSDPPDHTLVVFWNVGQEPGGEPVYVRETFAGPPAPTDLAVADLDHDGVLDLVLASAAHHVYAVRGVAAKGAVRHGFEAPEVLGPQLAFPAELTVADLDADGHEDVTVVSRHFVSAGVWVLWNRSTPGQLVVASQHLTEDRPLSILAADLDGDGVGDLALSLANRPTRVYLGTATPSPTLRFLPPMTVPTLPAAVALVAHDLDGDGELDFAYTDVREDRVQVVYGAGWPALRRGPMLPVARAQFLVAGDVDGDGRGELVIGADTSTELLVWKPRS